MNIKEQLHQELDRITVTGLAAGTTEVVDLDTGNGRLRVELLACDSIGCSFHELGLHTNALATTTADNLKQLSESLSKKICYLLEPIRPVEIDRDHCIVQMRSNPPQKDDDGTSYYELLAQRGGQITLRRYTKPRGQPRQIIAAHVTREVLGRLAIDFVATI